MDNHKIAKQYVQYNTELKVIICTQHKYTITSKNSPNEQPDAMCHFQDIGLPENIIDVINEFEFRMGGPGLGGRCESGWSGGISGEIRQL